MKLAVFVMSTLMFMCGCSNSAEKQNDIINEAQSFPPKEKRCQTRLAKMPACTRFKKDCFLESNEKFGDLIKTFQTSDPLDERERVLSEQISKETKPTEDHVFGLLSVLQGSCLAGFKVFRVLNNSIEKGVGKREAVKLAANQYILELKESRARSFIEIALRYGTLGVIFKNKNVSISAQAINDFRNLRKQVRSRMRTESEANPWPQIEGKRRLSQNEISKTWQSIMVELRTARQLNEELSTFLDKNNL